MVCVIGARGVARLIKEGVPIYHPNYLYTHFFPSVWANQRGLLGVKEISPSGFGVRQLACIKAFYCSHILITIKQGASYRLNI